MPGPCLRPCKYRDHHSKGRKINVYKGVVLSLEDLRVHAKRYTKLLGNIELCATASGIDVRQPADISHKRSAKRQQAYNTDFVNEHYGLGNGDYMYDE